MAVLVTSVVSDPLSPAEVRGQVVPQVGQGLVSTRTCPRSPVPPPPETRRPLGSCPQPTACPPARMEPVRPPPAQAPSGPGVELALVGGQGDPVHGAQSVLKGRSSWGDSKYSLLKCDRCKNQSVLVPAVTPAPGAGSVVKSERSVLPLGCILIGFSISGFPPPPARAWAPH